MPQDYWRERTLKEIASAVGTPISIDGPTRNRAFDHYARILFDIDLSKRVFDEILVEREGFTFNVELQYERRPLFCHHCYVIRHNAMNCKRLNPEVVKVPDCGKKQVTDAASNPPRVGNGASSSGTLCYVPVVPLPTVAPSAEKHVVVPTPTTDAHALVPPPTAETRAVVPHQQLPSPIIMQHMLSLSHQLQQVPLAATCKIFLNIFLKVIYLGLIYMFWR